jgi:two-component system, response regulator PdtaR
MKKETVILLVEDEVITAMLIRKQLKVIGYEVSIHVTTGEDAIIKARESRPDMIFFDIKLAGLIDGIEAASVIKSELNIPFIFMTCYDDPAIRDKAMMLNPLDYLIKPIEIKGLKDILDNYFIGKSLLDTNIPP